MKKQDFNTFFSEVILKCMGDLEKYAEEELPSVDCISAKKNINKKIFKYYQRKRNFVRYNYMSKKTPVALDRHKVAACMVYAILKAYPLKINRWISNLPERIILANEYLAFYVALNLIEMYEVDVRKEKGIQKDYQIIVPRTYHEEDKPQNTYESNLCKAWNYIKIHNMEQFDVFGYANVFFLLQKYTDNYMDLIDLKTELEAERNKNNKFCSDIFT